MKGIREHTDVSLRIVIKIWVSATANVVMLYITWVRLSCLIEKCDIIYLILKVTVCRDQTQDDSLIRCIYNLYPIYILWTLITSYLLSTHQFWSCDMTHFMTYSVFETSLSVILFLTSQTTISEALQYNAPCPVITALEKRVNSVSSMKSN